MKTGGGFGTKLAFRSSDIAWFTSDVLFPQGESPNITSISTNPLGRKHIETGGTLEIHCTATGESPLKCTWRFSRDSSSSTVLPRQVDQTLVIINAKEKDHQGSYECQVTNDFGHDISGALNIKIGEFYIHH